MFKIKSHKLHIDDKPVDYVPTKNKGGVIKPLYIVLHDTASPFSSQGDINWLSGQGNKNSSAHFVIARDGKITQLAPTNIKTWHAGQSKWNGKSNCNDFTIGIEIDNPGKLEKTSDNVYTSYFGRLVMDNEANIVFAQTPQHGKGYWASYTEDQIKSIVGTCQALIAVYGCTEIITHWMISPGRKIDTNPLFPLDKVRELSFGNKDNSGWSTPEIPKFTPDATVLVDNLNLRGQASMGNNIIEALSKGTRLDIISKDDEWFKVMTETNKGGYVHSNFIKLD